MLPSPKPETRASAISTIASPSAVRARHPLATARPAHLPLVRHRLDLSADEMHHDVVVLAERIVVARREGMIVGLDQTLIAIEIFERLAHLVAICAARLGDRERDEMHRVIGIGDADRRHDIRRTLDIGIFRLELRQYLLADRILLAEEAVGLHEFDLLRSRTGELGKASTGNSPMRHDGYVPARS